MQTKCTQSRYGFGIILSFFAYTVFFPSCISIKRVVYFNDLPDTITTPITITTTPFIDPKIESNDILAITVQTITANTATPITSSSSGSFSALNGFLVDKNGYIELSLIGFVKVAGLTTSEAREIIKQKAKEFFNEPVVNVRIANFDILMLGDVPRTGIINMPNEKVSIVDAIAMAGDLNLSARRDNILLIRNEGNDKKFVRFDMRSKNIYQSPYFYLKQRDMIYVEPSKYKIQNSDNSFTRVMGIVTSFTTLFTTFILYQNLLKK